MKLNIQHLHNYLDQVDNNVDSAVSFMACPQKMEILFNVIRDTVITFDSSIIHSREDLENRTKDIYLWLDQFWHPYCWRLHDVHFHPSFGHYVNCTYTCASELAECTQKILKEKFCA